MSDQILPVIDSKILQEKANEFGMNGAISVLKDFYEGYSSPYKKAIEEGMKNKAVTNGIEIPDILGILNDSISKEVDEIANTAVSKTFIPYLKTFLTRAPAEVKLSEILEKFIEHSDSKDPNDFSMELKKKESPYNWLELELQFEDEEIKLTLHEDYKSKNEEIKKYSLLSLPYSLGRNDYKRTMTLTVEGGVKLEMPFTTDVLKNEFLSYVAGLVIAKSSITIDVEDFQDQMFYNDDRCHCD